MWWFLFFFFFPRDVLSSTHLGDRPWVKVKGAACIILTSINHLPHSVWDFSISVTCLLGCYFKNRRICIGIHKMSPVHLTFPYYILAVEFCILFSSLIIFWLTKHRSIVFVSNRVLNVVLKMLHVAPKMCGKRQIFSPRERWGGWDGFRWWSGTRKGFKCSCGSRCRGRCTGWSSSASAGPGADLRSGSTTGPWPTCGPPATSHSVCPALGDPCCWSRARCSSGAWWIEGTKRWI